MGKNGTDTLVRVLADGERRMRAGHLGHEQTLFIGGKIVDPCERSLAAASVLVEGGRVSFVGPPERAAARPDARRVDVTGRYLLPGLADMHAHLAYGETLPDQCVRDELFCYLAHGVTTIRNAAGSAWHLLVRERLVRGDLLGPRMFTAGPVLEQQRSHAALVEPTFKRVSNPERARQEVIAEASAGFDAIKVYNRLDADVYEAIATTARAAGLPVFGHVPIELGLVCALHHGQASIEHLRGVDLELSADRHSTDPRVRFGGWARADDRRLRELAEATVRSGAWNVPTLVVYATAAADFDAVADGAEHPLLPAHLYPEVRGNLMCDLFAPEIVAVVLRGLPAMRRYVGMLAEIGGGVLAGTDTPGCRLAPGRALHVEMQLLADSGLGIWGALSAATCEAGRFLRETLRTDPRVGRIAAGMSADFLVLEADPSASLRALERIDGIMCAGHWLDGPTLEAARREVTGRNAPLIEVMRRAPPPRPAGFSTPDPTLFNA